LCNIGNWGRVALLFYDFLIDLFLIHENGDLSKVFLFKIVIKFRKESFKDRKILKEKEEFVGVKTSLSAFCLPTIPLIVIGHFIQRAILSKKFSLKKAKLLLKFVGSTLR
jgi:hypothetical protein